jgi:hypothetical protein
MSRSTSEIIKAIQRGLAGHLTFVAATRGWGMTSELALYPTIGAVLLAREWEAYCQRKVPRLGSGRGAPSTIDFFARSRSTPSESLAMEVKLLANGSHSKTLNVENDIKKLRKFSESEGCKDLYLLIVGRKSDFQEKHVFLGNKRIALETA